MGDCVNIVITSDRGKYLLQMRDNNPGICNPLLWAFFGGGIEDNEDVLTAAVREIEEELNVGARVEDMNMLGAIDFDGKKVYAVRYTRPVNWPDILVQEGAGAGFFTKDELLKIPISEQARQIAERFL